MNYEKIDSALKLLKLDVNCTLDEVKKSSIGIIEHLNQDSHFDRKKDILQVEAARDLLVENIEKLNEPRIETSKVSSIVRQYKYLIIGLIVALTVVIIILSTRGKPTEELLAEFDEQNWICNSRICEFDNNTDVRLGSIQYEYNLATKTITEEYYIDTPYGVIDATTRINLETGAASSHTLFETETFYDIYNYTGNYYSGSYQCESTDTNKVFCDPEYIQRTYDAIMEVFYNSGVSVDDLD